MDFRSCRTKRVVRSTLAGEAQAADGSIDHGYYVAAFMSEALSSDPATSGRTPHIPVYSVTDCRSLWDCVQKEAPTCEEKRTMIDVMSIRQTIPKDGMKWVPTEYQMSDGLTKIDDHLRDKFAAWLRCPVVVLHD